MGFKCGIVGLPNVGKSTLFNALTESDKAEAANYPFATIEPNIGRVAVPDKRLNTLAAIENSKKIIPTYMDFIDIAGLVKGASKGEGLGNKFLAHIREVDAIAHVVRCFENKNISHISSAIDPINDIETILTELKLADLETINNKLSLLQKKGKSGDKIIKIEISILEEIQECLNSDKAIIDLEFSDDALIFFNSLNLITAKPMLYICNVDEDSVLKGNNYSKLVEEFASKQFNQIVIVSAAIESQIAEFENENEKLSLFQELNLKESAINKVINVGYNLLNLITFFTCGTKETRAWTITKDTLAPQAAGKIHSDFEKGFIRAETISYKDFVEYSGESKCREKGKLRQEGKEYIVKEGDVMHFLFNV